MALDWAAKDTYYYVDQKNKMMLRKRMPWTDILDEGQGDAIGRNVEAYIAYNDRRFIEGIQNCWVKVKSNWFRRNILRKPYYYQGYRYPTHDLINMRNMSPDHTTYTIIALKLAGCSNRKLKDFVFNLRYLISKATPGSRLFIFRPNMWLWARAITGSKFYEKLYYLVDIPYFFILSYWQSFIYKLGNFGEELHQKDFKIISNQKKPKFKKFLGKLLFPIYSLHQQALQLKVMPDSKNKEILKKICLKITPKHNYVIKILLGDMKSFSKDDIYSYKPMTGSRWTGILIPELNDRVIQIIGKKESIMSDPNLNRANELEKDYLIKLYEISCNRI